MSDGITRSALAVLIERAGGEITYTQSEFAAVRAERLWPSGILRVPAGTCPGCGRPSHRLRTCTGRTADEVVPVVRRWPGAVYVAHGRDHADTRGSHYGLLGPGSSAATECPRCREQDR
jgi:hypothetical protein